MSNDVWVEGTSLPSADEREHRVSVRASAIVAVQEFHYRVGPNTDLLSGTRIYLSNDASFEVRQAYDSVLDTISFDQEKK